MARQWATTVHAISPPWPISVEGISASSRHLPALPAFWEENLMDVQRAPLTLPIPNRLIYSLHAYGPDHFVQPYSKNATYPDNMPALWDLHFGFVQSTYGLVVGEWGSEYRT